MTKHHWPRFGPKGPARGVAFAAMLAFAAAILSWTSPAQSATVDVVLLAGQSNMAGRALRSELPEELRQPQSDVTIYLGGSDTLGLAANAWLPLQPGNSQFGPEITLGRTLADLHPTRNFAFIKYAVGGTNLHTQWNPEGNNNHYTAFLSTVASGLQALRDAGDEPNLIGVVWMQGESDASAAGAAAYEANLTAFIAAARRDLFDGRDAPFIIGRLSDGQTQLSSNYRQMVQAAQTAVHTSVAMTGLVDTNHFGLATDNLHFNAQGQRQLGEAFAHELTALIPEPANSFLFALFGLGFANRRRLRVGKGGNSR